MADETKPVTSEPVAPATAPAAEAVAEATAPPAEPTATETPAVPATEETKTDEATKAAEESKETAAPKEEAKPIYEGLLRYTPTGNPFKSLFGLKEKFVFYYGDEAVPADKLAHLIKPGKSDLRETVAWSSQTGKGLLYFVKHADQKASPKGAISLAEIAEPKPIGSIEINFKLHGQQHDLLADSKAVRDGWLLSLKEKIEEAKALKEEIIGKEGYKEQLEKLSKPAPVAAVLAKTEGSPKKSTDERAPRSEASKTRPAKDRSQSRGKKVFAAFLGKKETDAAKEEPKAEEAKEATETPAPEVAAPASTEAPATSAETPAAEGDAAAAAAPAAPAAEAETKAEESKEAPKKDKTRRTSKFFASFKDTISPSKEKKQEDLIPPTESTATEPAAVPETTAVEAAKDAEPAAEAAPATEAAAVAPATNGEPKADEAVSPTAAAAAPKDERRRSSFFGDVQNRLGAFRAKTEKKAKDVKEDVKPSGEESKTEEAPAAPAAAVEETKAEEAKPAETTEATETAETAAKEPEAKPKKENKLFGGVTRSLSKAFRGDKAKKEKVSPPEKVAETEEAKPADEVKATEPVKEAEAPKEEVKKAEPAAPNSIGDVVPEAVNVGTAPKPSATVQATA